MIGMIIISSFLVAFEVISKHKKYNSSDTVLFYNHHDSRFWNIFQIYGTNMESKIN